MTSTESPQERAKYKAGDRLHFTPGAMRAPHGSAIAECDVEVVEVVDHVTATPYSPRFTYVVRALDGSGRQGTDDRELTEIEPAAEPGKCPGCGRAFRGARGLRVHQTAPHAAPACRPAAPAATEPAPVAEPAPAPAKARCPWCGQMRRLTIAGRLSTHPGDFHGICAGSGSRPAASAGAR